MWLVRHGVTSPTLFAERMRQLPARRPSHPPCAQRLGPSGKPDCQLPAMQSREERQGQGSGSTRPTEPGVVTSIPTAGGGHPLRSDPAGGSHTPGSMSIFSCAFAGGGPDCKGCGTTIPERSGPGRRRQFCSTQCKGRAKYRARKALSPGPILSPITCVGCGTTVAPRQKNQLFCGRKCNKATRLGRKVVESCACGATTTRTHRSSLRQSWRCKECRRDDRLTGQCSVVPWAQCPTCDRWHVDRRKLGYCSSACRPSKPKDPSGSCQLHYGDCPQCGRLFCSGYATKKFCSGKCAKRARNSIRRHRERAAGYRKRNGDTCDQVGCETFTIRQVAERDGWRCHLCGKRVRNRKWKGRAGDPEIDHLVPLSAGGAHSLQNVALSHRICNGRRSDKGAAQLRLFA